MTCDVPHQIHKNRTTATHLHSSSRSWLTALENPTWPGIEISRYRAWSWLALSLVLLLLTVIEKKIIYYYGSTQKGTNGTSNRCCSGSFFVLHYLHVKTVLFERVSCAHTREEKGLWWKVFPNVWSKLMIYSFDRSTCNLLISGWF